jgi:hypothetical protein
MRVRIDPYLPRLNKLEQLFHSILLLVNRQPELHSNDRSAFEQPANDGISIDAGEANMDLTFASNVWTLGSWSLTPDFHCHAVTTVPAGLLSAALSSASVMFQLLPRRL